MELLTLVGVAIPFVLSPGASFALTLSHAASGLRLAWLYVMAGTAGGTFVMAFLVGATGLGEALTANLLGRSMLEVTGGAVLICFGLILLRKGFGRDTEVADAPDTSRLVRWSFVTVVANPKALSLYLVVVPSLASPQLRGLTLLLAFAAIHMGLHTLWLFLVNWGAIGVPGLVGSVRAQRCAYAASGLMMMGWGLYMAAPVANMAS
ncbi:LysE family translocator [Natronoglycomyces albus]|uniref:LysE family transporter n=1 Tax=Natronoglycomyces albus TaxID=2811108 RepID=A0A895XTR3_9ACTN|nr:LysE family transporter [Natronoglycomyces albus]QSB05640.1 LysE family transporter [Natronoglycomyces albus]